jgi:DNA-binding transcriptional LysR family regulator
MVRARHPKLRVRVRFADDPMAGLLRDVDVAVCFGSEAPEGPWISHEIVRVPERLLATRRYLETRGTPKSTAALAKHDLLLWEARRDEPPVLPLRRGATLAVTPALTSTDIHLLRQCASDDLGIAFVPDAAFAAATTPGPELVPVLPEVVGRERAVRVVLPAALAEIPRIRAVLDQVQAFVARGAAAVS